MNQKPLINLLKILTPPHTKKILDDLRLEIKEQCFLATESHHRSYKTVQHSIQGKDDNQDNTTTDQNRHGIKLGIPLVTLGRRKDKVTIMTDNVITKDSKWYYDPEKR